MSKKSRNNSKVKNNKKPVVSKSSKNVYTKDTLTNSIARLGAGTTNVSEATGYVNTRLTQNYTLINDLYRSHWVVRKIIDSVPEDMVKNWINITTQLEPEQLKRLDRLQRNTRVKRDILKALKWGRLYGGAGAVVIIEGHEDILHEALDYDYILPGSFKGLLVGDRWTGLFPSAEVIDDITSPEFGLPKYYEWTLETGKAMRVHHTRVLRFTGRELPLLERYAEIGWGSSEIEIIFDELKKRDNASGNISYLLFLANLRILKMSDLGETLAIGDEESQTDLYNTVSRLNQMMTSMGIYVMDREDNFETHQYSFSGINEVYESFMLDLSGAADMPVTKLFGRSPAGFNATGESDMKNYYDMISQKQVSQLDPALDKLLPVMCISELGFIPDDLDYKYNPIMEPSEDELANIVDKKTNAIINVFNAGLISQKTGMKELKEMSETTGMFTNITDKDIESADDDIDSPGDLPMDETDFSGNVL